MATVVNLPSATGGGLTAGTSAILQALIARRQKELESRRLDIAQQGEDRMGQAQAFDRLINIAPLLPEGATIRDLPFLHGDIQSGLGVDPTAEIGDLVLNRETVNSVLRPMLINRAKELDPDGELLDRSLAGILTGEATSDQERELGRTRTGVLLDSINRIATDPRAIEQIGRVGMGLEQPVTFTDPATGKQMEFSTSAGAQITASLMQHYDVLGQRYRELSAKDQKDLAGELMEQLEAHEISLGRPKALQIIRAYTQSVNGDFEEGQSPLESLYERSDDATKTAINVFTGAARQGQDALEQFLGQTPQGQAFLQVLPLMESISKYFPKEEVGPMLESILEATGSSAQIDRTGILGTGVGPFGKRKFSFEQPRVPGNTVERTDQAPGQVPTERRTPDSLPVPTTSAAPDSIPESVRQQAQILQQDAADLASGRVDKSFLRRKYAELYGQREANQILQFVISQSGGR